MECIACSNIALKDLNILWSEICMIWFDVILISHRTWTQKLYVTSHLTFSCSESTQNTRSFCTPATFENTKITINMSLNTSTILATTNSYWHHWKKPSKLPTHLRGHHKDCCQAVCQHLDHKSGSTGIKSGEAVKASLEAVLNVAPPCLQLARLPALEAPTCPNLPPTILSSKVVFTSTTRYGGYLFSDERKNYSLVCLYKLLPAQTYLPPFLAEQCSKVVFNSIQRFSAYLQCPTGTQAPPANQYFFDIHSTPFSFENHWIAGITWYFRCSQT